MTGVPIRGGNLDTHMLTYIHKEKYPAHAWTKEQWCEDTVGRKMASEETKPTNTLILNLEPPDWWEDAFLLFTSEVPKLQDLMPVDLRWSWCNHNINKVYEKHNVLESSWNHSPDRGLWKNHLMCNWSLVPVRLGTAGEHSSVWYFVLTALEN